MVEKSEFSLFGEGKVFWRGDSMVYKGTLPDACKKTGTEVYVITKADMELLRGACLEMLTMTRSEMPEKLFESFPDELITLPEDGTRHQLYLDRHMYFLNPRDVVWIRYTSMDQAMAEGELDGNGE